MTRGEEKRDRFLTAKDVAERYGLPLRWVYRCRTLPRRKVGKYLRYSEAALIEWEKRHVTKADQFYGDNRYIAKVIASKAGRAIARRSHNDVKSKQAKSGKFALKFDIL